MPPLPERGARRLSRGLRALGTPRAFALAALALATAAPFWAGRFLPFLDLPQHVGLATVIHHYGDAAWDFQRFYELDLRPLPYWGFYLPVHLLAYLMPVATASKVVLTAYALALPLGLASVLGAFHRDRRLALFAVPLAFNTNLYMGFVSFVVALPLWLFAVAAAERHLVAAAADRHRAVPGGPAGLSGLSGRDARRRALWAGGLAVAVYFAHGQAFLLLVCAVGLLWLVHGPRLRPLLAFVPGAALFVYWIGAVVLAPAKDVAAGEHLSVLGALGVPGRITFNQPGQNVARLGEYLYEALSGPVDDLLFLGLGAVLLALVALRPGPPPRTGRGLRGALHRFRLEALFGGLLLAYFAAPMEIGLQWYVNPRHLIFAALLAPALAGPESFAGARRWLLVPLVVLAVAVPLNLAVRVYEFQAEVGPFDRVLSEASPGGRTLGLIFDNGAGRPVRTWPLLHFPAYVQAEQGGDLGFSFAGLPSIPVRYREGQQAPHPYEWRPGQFDWRAHGVHYDRILVRGRATGQAAGLGQRAERVVEAGAWTLYEVR